MIGDSRNGKLFTVGYILDNTNFKISRIEEDINYRALWGQHRFEIYVEDEEKNEFMWQDSVGQPFNRVFDYKTFKK